MTPDDPNIREGKGVTRVAFALTDAGREIVEEVGSARALLEMARRTLAILDDIEVAFEIRLGQPDEDASVARLILDNEIVDPIGLFDQAARFLDELDGDVMVVALAYERETNPDRERLTLEMPASPSLLEDLPT